MGSNISSSSIRGRAIREKDVFIDETPRQTLRYLMKVTSHSTPFEFVYSVLLDGDSVANDEKLNAIRKQAQSEMFGILQRLQASDEDVEFQGWRCIGHGGEVLEESSELAVSVKPAVRGS